MGNWEIGNGSEAESERREKGNRRIGFVYGVVAVRGGGSGVRLESNDLGDAFLRWFHSPIGQVA